MISAKDRNDKDSDEGDTEGGRGECSDAKYVDWFDCK